jgi:hypothetical protein
MGSAVNTADTSEGRSAATSRSRSPIVSRCRRMDPAAMAWTTPGTFASGASMRRASASASPSGHRPAASRWNVIACKIRCSLRCPKCGSVECGPRRPPARDHAACAHRARHRARVRFGPMPSMAVRSRMSTGVRLRRRSSSAILPVESIAAMRSAMPLPIAGRASSASAPPTRYTSAIGRSSVATACVLVRLRLEGRHPPRENTPSLAALAPRRRCSASYRLELGAPWI